jgi:hypothetical protein
VGLGGLLSGLQDVHPCIVGCGVAVISATCRIVAAAIGSALHLGAAQHVVLLPVSDRHCQPLPVAPIVAQSLFGHTVGQLQCTSSALAPCLLNANSPAQVTWYQDDNFKCHTASGVVHSYSRTNILRRNYAHNMQAALLDHTNSHSLTLVTIHAWVQA